MPIDPATAYRALLSRDARFDGRFFVGVRSTGIYCRPVCRVRAPREAMCRYFEHAAAAEAAGFRPCLRCRPELAPGLSLIDSPDALALAAARMLDAGAGEQGMAALAARIGVGERHLRRVFKLRFGVTPVAYAQTQRLLLAKRLLADSSLPIGEVAAAAGFGSLRRFHALFQARYRMPPSALRRGSSSVAQEQDSFELFLAYRPPYDWQAMLAFQSARALPGVECVDGEGSWWRQLRISHGGRLYAGWVALREDARSQRLLLRVSSSLRDAMAPLLARLRRQFDLDCEPSIIAAALGELASDSPGLRLPGSFDPFEQAVRAVLGQQVSVAAARTLAGRLVQAFGTPRAGPVAALTHDFPDCQLLAVQTPEALAALGILPSRARSILALATALAEGRIALDGTAGIGATLDALRALPGFGEWTVQYLAMRCLGWPDAFPHTDLIVRRAFPGLTPAEILRRAEAWRPWRAYACLHLWRRA